MPIKKRCKYIIPKVGRKASHQCRLHAKEGFNFCHIHEQFNEERKKEHEKKPAKLIQELKRQVAQAEAEARRAREEAKEAEERALKAEEQERKERLVAEVRDVHY